MSLIRPHRGSRIPTKDTGRYLHGVINRLTKTSGNLGS